jgi:hypothetical protein
MVRAAVGFDHHGNPPRSPLDKGGGDAASERVSLNLPLLQGGVGGGSFRCWRSPGFLGFDHENPPRSILDEGGGEIGNLRVVLTLLLILGDDREESCSSDT